jgi:hypothetical protein
MPKFPYEAHSHLSSAGYEYDERTDKYFNRGSPTWECEDKMEAGRRQGAFPSRTVDEFKAQADSWIETQMAKIRGAKE